MENTLSKKSFINNWQVIIVIYINRQWFCKFILLIHWNTLIYEITIFSIK